MIRLRALASERLALGGLTPLGDLAGGAVVAAPRGTCRRRAGTEVRPSTCTGRDGPASSTLSPCSSSMARTRP